MQTAFPFPAFSRQFLFPVFALLALTCLPQYAYGTEEVFYGGLQRQQVVKNAVFEVSDTFPSVVDQVLSVRDMIWFSVDEDTLLKSTTFTHWVDVTIQKYDASNTLIGTETGVRFTVNFNPAEGATYKYGYVYEFANVRRIKVTITATSSDPGLLPGYLRLEAKIIINRKYPFDCAASPVLLQKTQTELLNTSSNALRVGWQRQAGAEEYDLEWSFYDTLSPTISLAAGSLTDFDFIFRNNATRITTGQTWYEVPLIYPKGRVYWRIRGVRWKNGLRELGKWSSLKAVAGTLTVRQEWFWVAPHEQALNWQMQTVFAEGGKKLQSSAYFDGSMRQRQQVVRSDATNVTVASETVYDSLGRAAVQVMPAPVSFGTGVNDWTRAIKYNASYSAAQGKSYYSAADFFYGSANCNTTAYNPAAKMDSVTSAVGRYYSSNNPWKDRFLGKFTPAGDGYPFAVTEYMADGSGRVRRQGGVGPAFQLGSGHETRYFYSKPEQVELDRLFGSEAGYAAHYQKNAVLDPNGQISVTYVDAHGRTVATALAGAVPKDGVADRLQQLSNFTASSRLKKDLLNNVRDGMALTSTYTLLVTSDGAKDTFNYAFYPKLQLSIDSCLSAARCYDCKYDVEIKVLKECGDVVLSFAKSNFTAGQFDTLCAVLPDTIQRTFALNPGLTVGQYQVTKTIRLNQSALNYYADDYLKHLVCIPSVKTLQTNLLGDTSCHKTCAECYNKLGTQAQFRTKYLEGVPSPTTEDYAVADTIYRRALRGCAELCDQGDPSDCGIMYELMLEDISPGGQYAEYGTSTEGPGPDSTFVFTATTDKASMFYPTSGQYPFQKVVLLESGTNLYRDEFGNVDYVTRPDSTKTRIDSLTLNEFITYFKPSWAKTLVKAHPEYCSYVCCKQNSNTNWDSLFSTVSTYAQAVAAHYLPIDSLLAHDPFFLANPTLRDSMLTVWNSYTTTAPGSCSSPVSLTEILTSTIYCGGMLPCTVTPGGGCTADNNLYWQLIQSQYLSEKSRLKWNKIRGGVCAAPVPANTYCKNPGELCFGKAICGAVNPNPYQKKVSRLFVQQAPLTGEAAEDSLYSLVDTVTIKLGAVCDTTCAAMADQWIQKLSVTCATIRTASAGTLATLRTRFILVCKSGCDATHPYGSVTTNGTATASPYLDQNLQDAINKGLFAGADSSCTGCSAQLIDFPGTYGAKQYVAPPMQIQTRDSLCTCPRLTALGSCWSAVGQPSLLAYINSTSDVQLTSAQLTKLQNGCLSSCTFMDEAIPIPPILECNVCKNLTEVKAEWTAYITACGDTTTTARKTLLAAHLNQFFGLNRSYDEYRAFVQGPQTSPGCRYLCPLSRFPESKLDTACVSLDLQEGTLVMANLSYENLRDSMRRVFVRNYLGKCLGSELLEQFEVRLSQGEYQYTLYYYDQSSNLVRTVAPKGVVPLTTTADLTLVKNNRPTPTNPLTPPKYPNHTFISRYWYNTLNQVIRDSTPDRGDADYWYDRLGRLVLSQNAKQRPLNDYTYSRYDYLGRVIETGRIRKTGSGLATVGTIWDYTTFTTWLTTNLVGNYEVMQSYYDAVMSPTFTALPPYFGSAGQTNLRNRIATVTYEETKDADTLTYNYATHYTYDVGGNVKQLVQDIPELSPVGHRYKRIGYDYDLVSGKVNYVYYQKDSVDQFLHHYVYDADNRVQYVETSRDSLVWERDANYEYYLHGPLGRTELGERRVQGLDFAYTLQGWLKGMNASALSLLAPNVADLPTRDMGRDGKSSNTNDFARTKNVARDVAAFTLGYFYGDYRKVNTTAADNFEMLAPSTSDFNLASASLYNGNVRHAEYAIARLNESGSGASAIANPEGYNYKYDQLNRLVQTRAHINYTLSTYVWSNIVAASNNFQEDATFDANGNILTYLRNGNNSTNYVMDNLTYQYPTNNNKLSYIDDAQTNTAAYTGDLEDQASGNYAYDNIGNLTQDTKDSVSTITWTNAQKIGVVSKTDRAITFKYDAMQNRVAKYAKPNATNLEKRTYYIRDANGNVMSTYSAWVKNNSGVITWDSVRLTEQHIYGSTRVGMALTNVKLYPAVPKNPNLPDTSHYSIFEGWKRYELTNHLGNVMSVITDRKRGGAVSGTAIQWYDADVVSAQQYYPFGMLMPGSATASLKRQYTLGSNDYRYGFNGKEGDDEVKGDDNQLDYGMRIYDPRVGRFLSVDPIAKSFPDLTPYAYSNNSPIVIKDADGKSGEPVIVGDKMVITMDFYFYGTSKLLASKDNMLTVTDYLQTELNRYPSTAIGPDGKSYNVEFVVHGSVVTQVDALAKARDNVDTKYDPKMNFVRVDDGTNKKHNSTMKGLDFVNRVPNGKRTGDSETPDNSMIISSNELSTTAWIHEVVAHGLGNRSKESHINKWIDNPSGAASPSIRTHKFTTDVPKEFLNSEGNLDVSFRQVLPQDKSLMILDDWKQDKDGLWKGRMGGGTNTIFDEKGNQTIFEYKVKPKAKEYNESGQQLPSKD